MMRLVLAATLGANYGIYGPAFELMDERATARRKRRVPGFRKVSASNLGHRSPDSLREFIALVNRIRKENPALHNDWSLRFHSIDNDQLLAYSKQSR